MYRLVSLIFCLAITAAAAAPAFAQKRVALVIGNSSYRAVAKVDRPARDAAAIAAQLQKADFDVLQENNVGNLALKRALRTFELKSADAEIAVIYYSGHGIELGGSSYLIPVDAKLASKSSISEEAVELDRLLDALASGVNSERLNLVILDMGHDNPFLRRLSRTGKNRRPPTVAPPLSTKPAIASGTLIATAAKPGRRSLSSGGPDKRGVYTEALLRHLTIPGLDVHRVFDIVHKEVVGATRGRQEPLVYAGKSSSLISLVPAQPSPNTDNSDKVKADYDLAAKLDTRQAWEQFIATYKTGTYVELARERLTRRQVVASETTTSGDLRPPAPISDDLRSWNAIEGTNSAEALREFIKRYPDSPMSIIARRRLETLERISRARQEEIRPRQAEQKREPHGRQVADLGPPPSPPPETALLPRFPWPPPASSASYVVPRGLFRLRSTIGEVSDAIVAALENTGYVTRSFFRTPDGVAVVTQLERIKEDGSSQAEGDRWPATIPSGRSITDLAGFLKGLFFIDSGRYRVAVFIIQDQPFHQSFDKVTARDARTWVQTGANVLPPSEAARRADWAHCTVLIYEFASDGTEVRVVESRLTGKQHLEKAGIFARLIRGN